MNAAIARQHLIQIGRLALMEYEQIGACDERAYDRAADALADACEAFQSARPGGVWGGERCTDCNAPLRRALDRIIGVCDPCMSRWTALAVIGAPSGPLGGNDGGIAFAEVCRQDYNADVQRDMTAVVCQSCGSSWLFDDPPAVLVECEACRVDYR